MQKHHSKEYIMGLMTATEISEFNLSIEDQLTIHFRQNCYPPVPLYMITPAIEAIDAYWEMDYSKMIDLPNGVTFRGEYQATASAIIDNLRLDAWCQEDWDDFDEFGEV